MICKRIVFGNILNTLELIYLHTVIGFKLLLCNSNNSV